MYSILEKELKVGMSLYGGSIGYCTVSNLGDEKFEAEIGSKKYEFSYRSIGSNVFFSHTDYYNYGTEKFNKEVYAPYENVKSLAELYKNFRGTEKSINEGLTPEEIEYNKELYHFNTLEKKVKQERYEVIEEKDLLELYNFGGTDDFDEKVSVKRNELEIKKQLLLKIINNPFFAEIIETGCDRVYIGWHGYKDDVVDWRDKNYYALYKRSEFNSEGLELVRDFTISNGIFMGYEDKVRRGEGEPIAARDEFLQRVILENRNRQEYVNLAQSLANEQYSIITKPIDEEFIVEGCAGSGKTVILLHRISMLLFNESEKLKPADVYIISPNEVLNSQSNNVVIDLEIHGVNKKSLHNLYKEWIQKYCRKNQIILPASVDINKAFDNSKLSSDFLKYAYSNIALETFDNTIKEIIDNPRNVNGFEFVGIEKSRIDKERNKVYGQIYEGTGDEYLISYLNKIAMDYKEACSSVSPINVREKIEELKKKLEREDKKLARRDDAELYEIRERYRLEVEELNRELEEKEEILYGILCKRMAGDSQDFSAFGGNIYHEDQKFGRQACTQLEKEISMLQSKIEKKKAEYEKNVSTVFDNSEYLKVFSAIEALQLFLDAGNLNGEPILNRYNKPSLAESHYSKLINFYNEYHDRIPESLIKLNGGEVEFYRNHYRLTEKENRFKSFLMNKSYYKEYFYEIIMSVLNTYKEAFEEDTDSMCEVDLYYILRGLNTVYGSLVPEYKHISFDEFQEYSESEIELVRRIHNNCTLNLYGEKRQCINPKGINKELPFMGKYSRYTFNVNYRNGKDITEYINDNLGTEMIAIGLPSVVETVDESALNRIDWTKERRIALLVKSMEEYNQLMYSKIRDKICIDDSFEIDKNYINVIPIAYAKGLEFEEVYVIDKYMTENEKYVAYTRALNSLVVINS